MHATGSGIRRLQSVSYDRIQDLPNLIRVGVNRDRSVDRSQIDMPSLYARQTLPVLQERFDEFHDPDSSGSR